MERKSELTKALLGEKFKELVAKKGFEKLTIKMIIGEWTEILAYPGKQKYFGGRCNGILSVYDVTFNHGSVGH